MSADSTKTVDWICPLWAVSWAVSSHHGMQIDIRTNDSGESQMESLMEISICVFNAKETIDRISLLRGPFFPSHVPTS